MNNKSYNKLVSELVRLQSGLSQFGLCPKDWDIVPQTHNTHLIKNKSESDFYFVGKVHRNSNKKIDWQFITLASL